MNEKHVARHRSLTYALLGAGAIVLLLVLTGPSEPNKPANTQDQKGGGVVMLVDNFQSKTAAGFPQNAWRFTGAGERTIEVGTPMLRISGGAAPREENGFLLASLDLTKDGRFDASDYSGVRLALRGNRETYAVHLRTAACRQPGEFYEAPIETDGRWQVVNISFQTFAPHGVQAALDPAQLVQIGLAGAGKSRATGPSRVDLWVALALFYQGKPPHLKPLSAAERAVIVGHGTEPPFSGEYEHLAEKGIYTCKQCGTVLFRSSDKFDSGCGWPSFDDALPAKILRLPDPDGSRTEILCATCGAHLGHLFLGEGFTEKNARYCVNSISLGFLAGDAGRTSAAAGKEAPASAKTEPAAPNLESPNKPGRETAIFASGCFWGTQYMFQDAPGVIETTAGYTGGHTERPAYEQVCTGRTGHAESVRVVFDPRKTSYEALVRLFFETHDFSQVGGQGPDIGDQYRGEIFFLTKEQKETAEKVIRTLVKSGRKVATKVTAASTFWPAEEYHQDYYRKKDGTPYCHYFRKVF